MRLSEEETDFPIILTEGPNSQPRSRMSNKSSHIMLGRGVGSGENKIIIWEGAVVRPLDVRTRMERARRDAAEVLRTCEIVGEGISLLQVGNVNVMISALAPGGCGIIKILLVHGEENMTISGGCGRPTDMHITSEDSFDTFRKHVVRDGVRRLLHGVPELVSTIARPPGVVIVETSLEAPLESAIGTSLGILDCSPDWESG